MLSTNDKTTVEILILILTVINASAAVTLLGQRPEKNSGSERDSYPRPLRCQLSYQSYMRAVIYGLALYMGTF